MQTGSEIKCNPLKEWYDNLPHRKVREVKRQIVKACGITNQTFYYWMSGKYKVPVYAKNLINQIAEKELYEVEKPVTVSEI